MVAPLIALALVAGGAVPALGAGVLLEIVVRPERNPQIVCVGQKIELLARVTVVLVGPDVGWLKVIGPLKIEPGAGAKSSDTRVATITRKEPRPADNYGIAEPYQGDRYDVKGLKPGTATLSFNATLPAGWTGDQNNILNPLHDNPGKPLKASKTVNVKVQKCDYEVGAVHILTIPGGTLMTAVAEPVRVSADERGHLSGTGNLEWAVAVPPQPECPSLVSSMMPSSANVDIAGDLDGDGRLTLRFDDAPVVWDYHSGECSGNTLTSDLQAPIQLPSTSLAISAEGGSIQMSQTFYLAGIETPEFLIEDTEILTVVPISESGAVSLAQR